MDAQPDAWGLIPADLDPPASDEEIGVTTDGDGWDRTPPKTASVTRTDFAYAFLATGYGTLRYIVCRIGIHRRRKWRT